MPVLAHASTAHFGSTTAECVTLKCGTYSTVTKKRGGA